MGTATELAEALARVKELKSELREVENERDDAKDALREYVDDHENDEARFREDERRKLHAWLLRRAPELARQLARDTAQLTMSVPE